MRNPFEAANHARRWYVSMHLKGFMSRKKFIEKYPSQAGNAEYPAVPSHYPNREVRRALRHSRPLPKEWEAFFAANPDIKNSTYQK